MIEEHELALIVEGPKMASSEVWYRKQIEAGWYFLHERPAHASLTTNCLQELASEPGVLYVQGSMCRFEIPLSGSGTEYVRMETGFLTGCKHIWQALNSTRSNLTRGTGTDTYVNQKQKHTLRQCIRREWSQQCFDRGNCRTSSGDA